MPLQVVFGSRKVYRKKPATRAAIIQEVREHMEQLGFGQEDTIRAVILYVPRYSVVFIADQHLCAQRVGTRRGEEPERTLPRDCLGLRRSRRWCGLPSDPTCSFKQAMDSFVKLRYGPLEYLWLLFLTELQSSCLQCSIDTANSCILFIYIVYIVLRALYVEHKIVNLAFRTSYHKYRSANIAARASQHGHRTAKIAPRALAPRASHRKNCSAIIRPRTSLP